MLVRMKIQSKLYRNIKIEVAILVNIIWSNLREENEGVNIILKQANKGIRKDKFSALEYGLYYIKQEEDSKKKKKRFNIADFMFMT